MKSIGRNDPCACGSGKKYKQCCMTATARPNPAPNLLETALVHHRGGRVDEAGALYRQILRGEPNHANALHFLGLIEYQARRYEAAIDLMVQAINASPDALIYNSLGNAMRDFGEHAAAIECYETAIAKQPRYTDALVNLGDLRRASGECPAAIDLYTQAVAIDPARLDARNNIAHALKDQGLLAEAEQQFRATLAVNPRAAATHYHLANTLRDQGKLDASLDSYRSALALDPALFEAHNGMAIALRELAWIDESIASCRRAIAIKPDCAEAFINLGNGLRDLGKLAEAAASYRQAIAFRPELAEAHGNLGATLREQGNADEAIACYRQALLLRPGLTAARSNLLFDLSFRAGTSHAEYLAEAVRFGELMAARAQPEAHPAVPHAEMEKRLRIGFVSGDLNAHPVGYFLESVLSHLDTHGFELVAYAAHPYEDALTARIRPRFAAWRSLGGLSDEAAARVIRHDRVDILVDLSGHTQRNRLGVFAWKPAPVQVTWLGYFASTGLAAMDYVLGDRHVLPPEEAAHFVEQPWRLPDDGYMCFTPPALDIPVGALAAAQDGYVTFGAFGNLVKVNDAVVALWSRVLHAAPESRLLLKAKQLDEAAIRDLTAHRFASRGIAPERLILQGHSPRAEYLAAYNDVDIALSPFPYPGGTTTAEALWMGVPVLALHGDRFLAHLCESVLHSAGLPEWIARDHDDYVARAAAFAADVPRLAHVRANLRARVLASPMCDAPRFARNLEAAFRGMWHAHAARAAHPVRTTHHASQ